MSIPKSDINIPPISNADIVIDGSSSDIDEQGEVSVSGDYIEGSVNVAALGIGKEFYFLGRTMTPDTINQNVFFI